MVGSNRWRWALGLMLWAALVSMAQAAGERGPLDGEELRQRLALGEAIEGYEFQAADLVAALEMLDDGVVVRIDRARIIGPLDFTALPTRILQDVPLPGEVAARLDAVWQATAQYRARPFLPVHVVRQALSITRSEIVSRPEGFQVSQQAPGAGARSPVLEAGMTLFQRSVLLRDVTVGGDARLAYAVFAGGLNLHESEFRGAVGLSFSVVLPAAERRPEKWPEGAFEGMVFSGPVDFTRAWLEGDLRFGDTLFADSVSLDGAVLAGAADFRDVAFTSRAGFRRARFEARARFDAARFQGATDFREATFAATAFFPGVGFAGPADFHGVRLESTAVFDAARFEDAADFGASRFGKSVRFARASFDAEVTFIGAAFEGEAVFDDVVFDDALALQNARFGAVARFQQSAFRGDVNALGANFESIFSVRDSRFHARALFGRVRFDGRTDLTRTVFDGVAIFRGATFARPLELNRTTLGDYVDLRSTRIAHLDLDRTEQPGVFAGRLDLRGARVCKLVIRDVIFQQAVDLADSRLGRLEPDPAGQGSVEEPAGGEPPCPLPEVRPGEEPSPYTVDLRYVVFRDDAVFHRASLLGPLRLDWVLFDALAHFGSARFQVGPAGAGFVLSYPGFSELELGWGQLPPVSRWRQEDGLQPLSEVLGVLEGRFRANRQLESANAAYYHRKRAELAERRAAAVGGDRDATLAWLIAEAQWWTWGLLCGYGTRLDWLLGWAALTVLLFAALYATAGQFHREPHPPSTRDFEFRQRLFDFPKDFMAGAAHRVDAGPGQRQFIDALRFSAVVLFKIGYRDTTLTGRALGLDLRYFVMLEWLLGYGFLAAFVYTLAETLPLVNRLLGGIF